MSASRQVGTGLDHWDAGESRSDDRFDYGGVHDKATAGFRGRDRHHYDPFPLPFVTPKNDSSARHQQIHRA
eukprot:1350532-Karenia_brevis.AAC.1